MRSRSEIYADDSSIAGWNAFASFCFRMHDVPKGCECLREAVSIDATDIPTLLTYSAVQLSLGDLGRYGVQGLVDAKNVMAAKNAARQHQPAATATAAAVPRLSCS